MTGTILRPVAHLRSAGGHIDSVETLLERASALACERQELRTHGAGPELLERNRIELVRCQQAISYALIERNLAAADEKNAA